MKNCGHRFHILVTEQEFVEGVLVRCILPKYNPPTALQDRVLSLIQVSKDCPYDLLLFSLFFSECFVTSLHVTHLLVLFYDVS